MRFLARALAVLLCSLLPAASASSGGPSCDKGRARLVSLLAGLAVLAACTGSIPTDGSPEARRVAAWLSSTRWSGPARDAPVAPEATLTLSDFGVPLTLANLRRFGPDRIPGCRPARVERSRVGVTATWSCATPVDLLQRQVEFDMKAGRIVGARHVEAYQARISMRPSAKMRA